jgi:hypothetical protein
MLLFFSLLLPCDCIAWCFVFEDSKDVKDFEPLNSHLTPDPSPKERGVVGLNLFISPPTPLRGALGGLEFVCLLSFVFKEVKEVKEVKDINDS